MAHTDTIHTEKTHTDTTNTDTTNTDTTNTDTTHTDTTNTDTTHTNTSTTDTDTTHTSTAYTDTTHTGTKNCNNNNNKKEIVRNIPGLVINKQRKKIRKTKANKTPELLVVGNCEPTSSESKTKKGECTVNEITTEVKKIDEPVVIETSVEITLTDDLADSLVNPPTDHQVCDKNGAECMGENKNNPYEIGKENLSRTAKLPVISLNDTENKVEESHFLPQENSISTAKSDDSICKNVENEVVIISNESNNLEEYPLKTTKCAITLKDKVDAEDSVIVLENNKNKNKTDTSQENKEEKIEHLNRENEEVSEENQSKEPHISIKSQTCYQDELEINSETSEQKHITEKVKTNMNKKRKSKQMKVTDDDINFSRKCKSNDERRKSYSAVIKENTFKQPNNHSTTSSYPQPVPNSLSAKSEVVKNEVEHVSVIGKEVPLLAPNQEVWEQTSRRRKKTRGILKDSQCSERTPDRTITFSIEQTSPACDVLIEPQNENVENYEKENMNERMEG